jgi:hypothetical protein
MQAVFTAYFATWWVKWMLESISYAFLGSYAVI